MTINLVHKETKQSTVTRSALMLCIWEILDRIYPKHAGYPYARCCLIFKTE